MPGLIGHLIIRNDIPLRVGKQKLREMLSYPAGDVVSAPLAIRDRFISDLS